jgi:hypothetical protein
MLEGYEVPPEGFCEEEWVLGGHVSGVQAMNEKFRDRASISNSSYCCGYVALICPESRGSK